METSVLETTASFVFSQICDTKCSALSTEEMKSFCQVLQNLFSEKDFKIVTKMCAIVGYPTQDLYEAVRKVIFYSVEETLSPEKSHGLMNNYYYTFRNNPQVLIKTLYCLRRISPASYSECFTSQIKKYLDYLISDIYENFIFYMNIDVENACSVFVPILNSVEQNEKDKIIEILFDNNFYIKFMPHEQDDPLFDKDIADKFAEITGLFTNLIM